MKRLIQLVIVSILLSSLTFKFGTEGGFALKAAFAQTGGILTINWQPPTMYTDGSALIEQDLDFYTFYCNGAELKQINSIIGTYTNGVDVTGLSEGGYTCHITVTTVPIVPNVGTESGPSNTINFTIGPRVPMAPAGLIST